MRSHRVSNTIVMMTTVTDWVIYSNGRKRPPTAGVYHIMAPRGSHERYHQFLLTERHN